MTVLPKNIIVFCSDEQRADSLGCMGNPLAHTPHLDELARQGLLCTRHYAVNPVCMPSRAAFVTGRYPQANGVIDNGIHLPARELTLPEVLRRNGYRTAAFGKLHFQTFKPYEGDTSLESMGRWRSGELADWTGPYYGFQHVDLTVDNGEDCHGAYGLWRTRQFPGLKLGFENRQSREGYPQFSCWKSNLPVEAHYSTWIADRAIDYLNTCSGEPFFMFVSFPDPHYPFTPPAPYHSMFDGVTFPAPHAMDGENDAKPKPYRDAMTGDPFSTDGGARFYPDLTDAAYQQIVAHTYGMIALIDHSVGRVLDKLGERGLRDNTIVVFTSDHGDLLGDHFLLLKGQLPCRSLLHIPLIIADPDTQPGTVDAPCSNVDVMPTLLARCGLSIPDDVQGVVLPESGEVARRDYAFEAGWSKASSEYHHVSIYTQDWHLAVFPNLCDGELYDLRQDPFEHHNLFNDPGYRAVRGELTEELLFAAGAAEPPRPPVLTDW